MPKKHSWARKNLRSLHESLQTRSLFQCRPWISWVLCRNQECGRRVKRQWLLKKKIKLYLNGNGASNQPQTEMDLTTFMFSCDNFDLQEDLRYFADTAMERPEGGLPGPPTMGTARHQHDPSDFCLPESRSGTKVSGLPYLPSLFSFHVA